MVGDAVAGARTLTPDDDAVGGASLAVFPVELQHIYLPSTSAVMDGPAHPAPSSGGDPKLVNRRRRVLVPGYRDRIHRPRLRRLFLLPPTVLVKARLNGSDIGRRPAGDFGIWELGGGGGICRHVLDR
ncbi:hypothetical protein Dimus_012069 [Dionaea muscipula]